MSKRKTMRLLGALAYNRLGPSIPFLRVLPTDFCNLQCSYCWQRNSDKHMMSLDLFKACVDRARSFHVGLVSFLGGEPTIWPSLIEALRYCDEHHICTDLTTNGTRLTEAYLDALSEAGLDLLNISVDGLQATQDSKKNCLSRPGLLDHLTRHIRERILRVRLNAVICKNNHPFIAELLGIAKAHSIPISLGFAMYRTPEEFDPDIHFDHGDLQTVQGIADMLAQARKDGVRLIDPMEYYTSYLRFLNREQFWVCNYATRRGWINVDPYGYIRDCTKKFGRLDHHFPDLTVPQLVDVRAALAEGVKTCNQTCYSNCAFDGAYFARHKMQFLQSGIA